jgi:hypothetical protein
LHLYTIRKYVLNIVGICYNEGTVAAELINLQVISLNRLGPGHKRLDSEILGKSLNFYWAVTVFEQPTINAHNSTFSLEDS